MASKLNLLVKKTSHLTTSYQVTLSPEDVLSFLRGNVFTAIPLRPPDDAEVTVRVPGGGDYSNCTLRLEDVGGLTITWTETKEVTE